MNDAFHRTVIYEPSDGEAGLAVSYHEQPGPHETKFRVEQLWPPSGDDETGRAEAVYVGDALQAVSLIEALAQWVETDLEIEVNRP